jgi:hypothetical protein
MISLYVLLAYSQQTCVPHRHSSSWHMSLRHERSRYVRGPGVNVLLLVCFWRRTLPWHARSQPCMLSGGWHTRCPSQHPASRHAWFPFLANMGFAGVLSLSWCALHPLDWLAGTHARYSYEKKWSNYPRAKIWRGHINRSINLVLHAKLSMTWGIL